MSSESVRARSLVREMLSLIGEQPEREGLLDTPRRVVTAWNEWFGGYAQNPADVLRTFEDGAEGYDEMVVLDSIPVMSHCEHHLCPFVGTAVVGYVPHKHIVGLSKIPRLVNVFARRLQVQERLTNQIADSFNDLVKPKGVGVVIRAEHFCMSTRGVHTPGVVTTTSALRGVFKDSGPRTEFLSFATRKKE